MSGKSLAVFAAPMQWADAVKVVSRGVGDLREFGRRRLPRRKSEKVEGGSRR